MLLDNEHRYWLTCDCHDLEHQAVFAWFEDDDDPFLSLSVHLAKKPLWARIKIAIKYILGYQSPYGAFGEILVNTKDAADLRDFIGEFVRETQSALR
jgi:hypothetical protein